MANNYVWLYVPWYSPQFCKGIWYHPFYPMPTLEPSASPTNKEIMRATTPLQALDTKNIPSITQSEIEKLNTTTKLPNFQNSKYFVLVSLCEDDIHKSLKYGIWTSTAENNQILNQYYISQNNLPVYLFFSVMGSGMFVGVAQMTSEVNFHASFNGWYPNYSNLGYFRVKWLFVKDVLFKKISYIKVHNGLSVVNCQDCQEIPKQAASKLVNTFVRAKKFKSLLEDFEYYNRKEELVLSL